MKINTGVPLLLSGMKNAPHPDGPLRILKGEEYSKARALAKKVNDEILLNDPFAKGKVIHEIHPVKLNGSPTDLSNKVYLTKEEHIRYNIYWRKIIKDNSPYVI